MRIKSGGQGPTPLVAKGLRRTEGTLAQARRRDRGEPRQGIASAAVLAVVVAAWCLLLGGPTHAQEPLPEVTIAAEADVDESENAVFTLTRTGALEKPLTVQVAVSQEWTGSEVGEPRRLQEPLPSAATFQAGASHATLSLPSRDDQLHQSDVVVAVEIVTGEGYTSDRHRETASSCVRTTPSPCRCSSWQTRKWRKGNSCQYV